MRVGIVCPYSWEVPGGVQVHVRDLAEALQKRGHTVSVLAPGPEDQELPEYVVPAGRAMALPYNGSVARTSFGPVVAGRVRRWLSQGQFDVVHVHEPGSFSVGLIALWWADVPVVATFHTSMVRSRMMNGFSALLRSTFEKISARIAVSEQARTTLVQHLGSDAVLIPNGLYVDRMAVDPDPRWVSDPSAGGGTVSFLGRLDEPRKGLAVLLEAWPEIHTARPDSRLLVAGRGDAEQAARQISEQHRGSVQFLGAVDDHTKATMLASSDLYIAPHIGGESFGIVLAEAMAAGAPVLASDLPAFRAVLNDGVLGELVPVGDSAALAQRALALLGDDERRADLRYAALHGVRRYDWSSVTTDIEGVYEMAIDAAGTDPSTHLGMPGR